MGLVDPAWYSSKQTAEAKKILDESWHVSYMFHVEQGAWQTLFVAGGLALGVRIDDRMLRQFSIYLDELRKWNDKMNLTSLDRPEEIAVKHFLDSLVGLKVLVQRGASVLDIGTGAGFPGLPLKIFDPSFELTLLEPRSKKTAFLRHIIGTLQLRTVTVIPQRIEQLAREEGHQERYAYVITRACNVTTLLPAVPSLLRESGQLVLWRAKGPEPEMPLSRLRLTGEVPYTLPQNYGMRRLLIMEKAGSA